MNRTNLAWVEEWQVVLDRMAAAGVASVRLTLVPPFDRTAEIVAYAGQHGMQVLLNLPLSLAEYYEPGALPRPGNDKIRAVRRLSDLDEARYARALGGFLAELDRRGARVAALEPGNEINWADFNGDLPVTPVGQIFDHAGFETAPEAPRILAGLRRYRGAIDVTRRVAGQSRAGAAAAIVTAGLYSPSDWVRRSGGSALTLDAAKALFDRLGITEAADALAVHVYPQPASPAGRAAPAGILADLSAATAICGRRGAGKPCYVTEWGFPQAGAEACRDDRARLALMRTFERALACVDRERDLRAAYLFAWDESPQYGVWRCDRLLDAGGLFRDPAAR